VRALPTSCWRLNFWQSSFLAVTGPRENEEVIGSACYFLSPATNLAEVAFMVAPEFQGAGLGTALQARLQEYAMSRGVRGFVSEIVPRNTSMLRLAARAQGTMTTSRDVDAVHVTVLFPDKSITSHAAQNAQRDSASVVSSRARTKAAVVSGALSPRAASNALPKLVCSFTRAPSGVALCDAAPPVLSAISIALPR
jgi:GNAT superfamily N-acetyltransferase